MRKYRLTRDEKRVVESFKNSGIPWVFSAGEYRGYFLYFEYVCFEICTLLLKGRRISKYAYDKAAYNDYDYQPQIDPQKLFGNEKEFYNSFLSVINIMEKYYNLYS